MKRRKLFPSILILILTVFAASAGSAAVRMRIKLATLAPTGSSYHQSLLRMGEAWRKSSDGAISLVVYADGKLGGESDAIGLLEIDSIQAAMLTGAGLSYIEPDISGLHSIPMFIRSSEELEHLQQSLWPRLSEKLERKGYVSLFSGDAGFVHFFSKVPVRSIDDMRSLKVYTPVGYPHQMEAYQKAGFKTIPLETADILSSLQTGLIDVTPAPPIFALATQIDRIAPYMLDINWSPMIGALIIRKSTWDKIPPALHPGFRQAATRAGDEIKASSRQEYLDAVEAMKARGLTVVRPDESTLSEWRMAVETSYPLLRGKVAPEDIFDDALSIMDSWRKAGAAQN